MPGEGLYFSIHVPIMAMVVTLLPINPQSLTALISMRCCPVELRVSMTLVLVLVTS